MENEQTGFFNEVKYGLVLAPNFYKIADFLFGSSLHCSLLSIAQSDYKRLVGFVRSLPNKGKYCTADE
jgi:hypothetical protein